ncbi:MAG: 4-(cytidine 5'-diphospho)-2-C-methyl-D-erythritol kinase [Actinomycetia bacterium]|nr:4-(cytidine 5'-diphospho)-2-C-methyl-D-erythritol kinase [Actinomycetes bacterium]
MSQSASPFAVRVSAPAKVNLYLEVGPVRRDGYHELVTVFQAVGLHDEVVASHAPSLRLAVHAMPAPGEPSGPGAPAGPSGVGVPGVPSDSRNLAWRAAELLAARHGIAPRVRLDLYKAIPVAGGMAGGSADAAAALLACATLWATGTSRDELAKMAGQLGSDVAFPLLGGTALGTGRGEVLAPALCTGRFHWVFALADFGISAGDAYRELDRLRATGRPARACAPDAVLDALRSGDPRRLAAAMKESNDLQPAALSLAPSLRRVLAAGRDLGALVGIVSGSGATCAFLAADEESAEQLAAALTTEGVCRAARVAAGPVPGARVLAPRGGRAPIG